MRNTRNAAVEVLPQFGGENRRGLKIRCGGEKMVAALRQVWDVA